MARLIRGYVVCTVEITILRDKTTIPEALSAHDVRYPACSLLVDLFDFLDVRVDCLQVA